MRENFKRIEATQQHSLHHKKCLRVVLVFFFCCCYCHCLPFVSQSPPQNSQYVPYVLFDSEKRATGNLWCVRALSQPEANLVCVEAPVPAHVRVRVSGSALAGVPLLWRHSCRETVPPQSVGEIDGA